jgi:predicted outer membrane repeat protein
VPSAAPTLSGEYNVWTWSELDDAIDTAENGRQWKITVMTDIWDFADDIKIYPDKVISVVGSSALGRRARMTLPVDATKLDSFFRSKSHSGGHTLELENLDFSSRGLPGSKSALSIKSNCVLVLKNVRIADVGVEALYLKGTNIAVFVHDSEFVNNHATSGAAIFTHQVDTKDVAVEITNSVFAQNTASADGAAIIASGDTQLTIRNCSMFDNHAAFGTVITLQSFGEGSNLTQTIQDSRFWNNTAQSYAGAVSVGSRVRLEVVNTVFADNAALASGGGAMWASSDANVTITNSTFERNTAPAGAGGALLAYQSTVHLIDTHFTKNQAEMHGGAVRGEGQTQLYPRGGTQFIGNTARVGGGGAISLDASSLKSNEAALVFAENEARLGGAVAAVNEASVTISPGCMTTTFEMKWALSEALSQAVPSVLVRRVRSSTVRSPTSTSPSPTPNTTISDQPTSTPATLASTVDRTIAWDQMVDEHGEWMMLYPSVTQDTSVSFCLAPGQYEIRGSEGGVCNGADGWGGGYLRVTNLEGSALLDYFTMGDSTCEETGRKCFGECAANTNLTVKEDVALTSNQGMVLFQRNRATGTAQGFCGTGCGGALYLEGSSTAKIDNTDFALNSATDGGALFVDLLGDLSLFRVAMRNNEASMNGGAMNVGTAATVSVSQSMAKDNIADCGSGGMVHLSDVAVATLNDIDAIGNSAGTRGGAAAVFNSARSTITLTNSTVRHNKAREDGGGALRGELGGEGARNSAYRKYGRSWRWGRSCKWTSGQPRDFGH